MWNSETGRKVTIFKGHRDWVRAVAWSPDGETVVSGSDDETAMVCVLYLYE